MALGCLRCDGVSKGFENHIENESQNQYSGAIYPEAPMTFASTRTDGFPLPVSWLDWLHVRADQHDLHLLGGRLERSGWRGCELAEAAEGVDTAIVRQRVCCGGARTELLLWADGELVGVWVCRNGSGAERSWQLVLLEALVLSSRAPALDELAAK